MPEPGAGLTTADAAARLARVGLNVPGRRRRSAVPRELLRQFTSPLVLLLIAAAGLSVLVGDASDATIILGIVAASGLLGFWQEHGAATAVARLLAVVEPRATVWRDGAPADVPAAAVVPGDVVLLSAGAGVPADCRVLDARDLFVDEAALTGETFPVEKRPDPVAPNAPLAARTDRLFQGTHVVSGTGRGLVERTGAGTAFAAVAARLQARAPETEFERGVRRFGAFLMEVTLLLVLGIFAVNVYLARPAAESFLFALALAVGLTPQLLPAVVSVNLARGARRMARARVIVKRLAAIENFGSMDVLCCDKTGTLTAGAVRVHAAVDAAGAPSDAVFQHAYLNARFQAGFANPIDAAVRVEGEARGVDAAGWAALDEVPYDFVRRRLGVLCGQGAARRLIVKGAVPNVLAACAAAEVGGRPVPLADARAGIDAAFRAFGTDGYRTLGVAARELPGRDAVTRDDERDLTFLGFLVLGDPPKPDAAAAVAALGTLGVTLKMITGDAAPVAAHVARAVGLDDARLLTGAELRATSDAALAVRAAATDVFAEIEPNQKERVVRALRAAGHVVGYLGDGINDAPALHAADVGVSVQGAVDVAKDAADLVVLEPDLGVLAAGVRAGRRTFANTLKYVFMATSANFGNMVSMAGASLFLPFLPLLPTQILLTNLLTDLPELTIAADHVDAGWVERPHRWRLGFIQAFMVTFGLVSSVFDYLTFWVLRGVLHAGPAAFRTGWFVESVASATLIVLVVRTREPVGRARPARALAATTLTAAASAAALPYTPLGRAFGFVPLPAGVVGLLGLIVLAYLAAAEAVKRQFYRRASGWASA